MTKLLVDRSKIQWSYNNTFAFYSVPWFIALVLRHLGTGYLTLNVITDNENMTVP